jgi:hypothetical protein
MYCNRPSRSCACAVDASNVWCSVLYCTGFNAPLRLQSTVIRGSPRIIDHENSSHCVSHSRQMRHLVNTCVHHPHRDTDAAAEYSTMAFHLDPKGVSKAAPQDHETLLIAQLLLTVLILDSYRDPALLPESCPCKQAAISVIAASLRKPNACKVVFVPAGAS